MLVSSKIAVLSGLLGLSHGVPIARQDAGSFVTTDGGSFQLDGEEFIFAGSNAYYFPFSGVSNHPPADV